jgi:hypothetical protein
MTATEIAEYEQEKEMYRKMGIDIESVWRQQAWKEMEPIRKALAMQEALKTETVIEVQGERLFPYCPFCGAKMENGDDDL